MTYWLRMYFSDPRGHARAIYEILVLFAFSWLPFIVTAFVRSAEDTSGKIFDLSQLFTRGQAYLLAYALFGSIFWLAFLKPDKPLHGARAFLGLIAVLITLPVIGMLGFDPTFSTIINPVLVAASFKVYFALLFIRYLLLFYINVKPPAADEILKREGLNMRDRYREMKKHGQDNA